MVEITCLIFFFLMFPFDHLWFSDIFRRHQKLTLERKTLNMYTPLEVLVSC